MKCPTCSESITPTIVGFDSSAFMATKWKCIAFCCPRCQAIISAQIDPVALKSDTVAEVLDALKHP